VGKKRTELVKQSILDREDDEAFFVPLSRAEEIDIGEAKEQTPASAPTA
jgi:hypothetical protein